MHHLLATASAASLTLLAASQVPVLTAGSTAGSTADPVALTFSPKAGTQIERSITISTAMEMGDLTVVMGGQEVPQMYLPDITLEIDSSLSLTVIDRFIEPQDGLRGHPRVREISDAVQTVDVGLDAGGSQDMEDTDTSSDASSPLKGFAFRIGTDGDGEHVATWTEADGNPDDSLLDGLRPALDLAGLLPKKPVEVDATWEADAAALAEILRPSGDLAWEWSGDDADSMPTDPAFESTGELKLRLVELVDNPAGGLALIEFSGVLTEVVTSASNLDRVPVTDGTATEVRTTRFSVEGELFWNVDLGLLHSVDITMKGEGDQVTTRDENQPGAAYESTMVHTSDVIVRVK